MTTIRTEDRDGGVRVLRLDRPPANAIDEDLLRDLDDAMTAARDDAAVRAVVVTGSGAFFCAGFDFAAPTRDRGGEAAVYALYNRSHLALLTLPKPTLALVNGHTLAGGFVIALACDYRLGVAGEYKVGLNEVAVGAAFPRVAAEIVRLRLPHARAGELVLGAAQYPASQAVRLGLVDELLDADAAEATALRRAARLGAYPQEAYAHAKQWLLGDTLTRIAGETPEQAVATLAVWNAEESRAARRAQRRKLGIER
jgi:enoyl-CoA hydratase/carnithine racemase